MPARRMTKSTVDALASAVGNGLPDTVACAAVSISVETVRQWRKRGRLERARIEAGGKASPRERPYLKFFDRMEQARALGIEANLKRVTDNAENGDWRAARWLLTRFPEFRDKPPSAVREAVAGMLASALEGREDMTPTAFLAMVRTLQPETADDVDAWMEVYGEALKLARAELELQQERGDMVSRSELADYVALVQAALREGLNLEGWFGRDLEDLKAGTMDVDTVIGRVDSRINAVLAGQPTPGPVRDADAEADDETTR